MLVVETPGWAAGRRQRARMVRDALVVETVCSRRIWCRDMLLPAVFSAGIREAGLVVTTHGFRVMGRDQADANRSRGMGTGLPAGGERETRPREKGEMEGEFGRFRKEG